MMQQGIKPSMRRQQRLSKQRLPQLTPVLASALTAIAEHLRGTGFDVGLAPPGRGASAVKPG